MMYGSQYLTGKTFDELEAGEKFITRLPPVDESSVRGFCSLTGDINPLHLDEALAKNSIHGGRIAPGTMTAALAFTPFAMTVYGTGMALLGIEFSFTAPLRIGDTLTVEIEILEKRPSRRYEELGGVIRQRMTARIDSGETVASGEASILVAKAPLSTET